MDEEQFNEFINYLSELLAPEGKLDQSLEERLRRLNRFKENMSFESIFLPNDHSTQTAEYIHGPQLKFYFDSMDVEDQRKLKTWLVNIIEQESKVLRARNEAKKVTESIEPSHRSDPSIRIATEKSIENIATKLYSYINAGEFWQQESETYNVNRSAAASILSNLAYCDVNNEEFRHRERALLVPSHLFRQIVGRREYAIGAILRRFDFVDFEVFRTRRFVALLVRVGEHYFVAVRGTIFAYDWLINFTVSKSKTDLLELAAWCHSGFLAEAEELSRQLYLYFLDQLRFGQIRPGDYHIHYCGHSLGGAVASIARHKRYSYPDYHDSGEPTNFSDGHCYIFGAPRICSSRDRKLTNEPIAVRRHRDIIPSAPPKLLGYENYRQQYFPNGTAFSSRDTLDTLQYIQWIISLACHRFQSEHSMEVYRREVLASMHNLSGVTPHES